MNNDVIKKDPKLSRSLVLLMAIACGITVANLYYAQPLLGEIARTFQVSEAHIGVIAMLTQIGYAAGMFFILPLGDIKERRFIIVLMLCLASTSLMFMSFSFRVEILVFAAFTVGFTSVVPQLIVPFAAQLAEPKERGGVIGNVMSGLLIGILLSRTFSGIIGSYFGWRVVYSTAACMMLILAVLLKKLLPMSHGMSTIKYGKLLGSLWGLIKTEPALREASVTGAMMFGGFSIFWTSLIFLLESPAYRLGAEAAGLFGLVGVTGALAAPIVGRAADRKGPRFTLGIAIIISTLSFICFWSFGLKLWGLVVGVILLDLGTQSGQISNQTRIQALSEEARNRINTVFMVSYFIGGSLGSILGAYCFAHFGWSGVCAAGLVFELTSLVVHFFKYYFDK